MSAAPPDFERLSRSLALALGIPPADIGRCVVAATEPDLPAVLRLRREVIGDHLSWSDEAYLRWRYRLCDPPSSARDDAPGATRLWLFKARGQVLGCLGAERVVVETGSGTRDGLRYMDLMSDPQVRGVGIGAWLNLVLLREAEVNISVGGSDQSIGMIGRLFHRMPDRRVWSVPLRIGDVVRSRWPWTTRVPRLAATAGLVDAVLSTRRRIALRAGAQQLDVVPAADPDESVDALSDSMSSAGLTLVPRTSAGWRWRFFANPRRAYALHLGRRDGRTVAAVVTRTVGDTGEIVDWVWDAGRSAGARGDLLRLFAATVDRFAREGAAKVRTMTYDALSESVCRSLGMRRRDDRSAYAVRASPPSLETELVGARWFVTFGDSDGD